MVAGVGVLVCVPEVFVGRGDHRGRVLATRREAGSEVERDGRGRLVEGAEEVLRVRNPVTHGSAGLC